MTDNQQQPQQRVESQGQQSQSQQHDDGTDARFSQADLDRLVNDRLARERQKYAGFDEIKAKAEELDRLQEQSKTETQRLADSLADSERRRTDAELRLQEANINRAIQSAAQAQGFVDPEAAALLIERASLEFDEQGNPKDESLDSALASLAERRPYLRNQRTGSADQGVRGAAATASSDIDMNELLRRAAGH